jgi:hypothetical protein
MLLCLNWFSFPDQIIIYRVIVLYIKWKYVFFVLNMNLFLLDGNTSLLENYRSIGMSSFVHHHTRHRTDIGDKWQKD